MRPSGCGLVVAAGELWPHSNCRSGQSNSFIIKYHFPQFFWLNYPSRIPRMDQWLDFPRRLLWGYLWWLHDAPDNDGVTGFAFKLISFLSVMFGFFRKWSICIIKLVSSCSNDDIILSYQRVWLLSWFTWQIPYRLKIHIIMRLKLLLKLNCVRVYF